VGHSRKRSYYFSQELIAFRVVLPGRRTNRGGYRYWYLILLDSEGTQHRVDIHPDNIIAKLHEGRSRLRPYLTTTLLPPGRAITEVP
jgi:hypothetical protein